jgi:hypothetical protein
MAAQLAQRHLAVYWVRAPSLLILKLLPVLRATKSPITLDWRRTRFLENMCLPIHNNFPSALDFQLSINRSPGCEKGYSENRRHD